MGLALVRDGIVNHYANMPQNTRRQIVSSMTLGVIWGTAISGGNLAVGVTYGGLYALASFIHAFVTPFFKAFIEEGRNILSWNEEMGRGMLASLATTVIARAYGIPNEFTLVRVIFYGLWLLWNDPQNMQNLNRANWVPIGML